MKSKFNLIYSTLSLMLTVCLLIMTAFCWYTSNREVDASGISAVSMSESIYNIEVNRYRANVVNKSYIETTDEKFLAGVTYYTLNNGTYLEADVTVGNTITGTYYVEQKTITKADKITEATKAVAGGNAASDRIRVYDPIGGYDYIIYEITFNTILDEVDVLIQNTDSTRTTAFNKTTVEGETIYYNWVSNVAVFNELETSGSSFVTDEVENTINYAGEMDNNTKIDTDEITTLNTNGNYTDTKYSYYLLFSYNEININKLSTVNLGTTADKILFKEDIQFILKS